MESENNEDSFSLMQLNEIDILSSLSNSESRSMHYYIFQDKKARDINISAIMEMFKTKSLSTLKKEYVRINIIRSFKKNIRIYTKAGLSLKKKRKSLHKNEACRTCWESFYDYIEANKSLLNEKSKTANGPKTDGKAKRRNLKKVSEKTCNSIFCAKFFSDPYVKEAFDLYLKCIFYKIDPSELSKFFKYFCCVNLTHEQECSNKWSMLLEFFSVFMFEDLNVVPFDRFFPKDCEMVYEAFNSLELVL